MGNKLLRDAGITSLAVFVGVWAFTHRPQVYAVLGIDLSQFSKSNEQASNQNSEVKSTTVIQSGSAVALTKGANGHFWANASVNKTTIKFLVDTGASIVALTPEDAKRAGVPMNNLKYNVPINTAAGKAMGAQAIIGKISVGTVKVKNVRAVVIPVGLNQSLLGMSFLGELSKVEASKKSMILRQ